MRKLVMFLALGVAGYEIYCHHLSKNNKMNEKWDDTKDSLGKKAKEVKEKIKRKVTAAIDEM